MATPPAMAASIVDLPAPLGPRMHTIWPSSTPTNPPRSAVSGPYRTLRPSTLSIMNVPPTALPRGARTEIRVDHGTIGLNFAPRAFRDRPAAGENVAFGGDSTYC